MEDLNKEIKRLKGIIEGYEKNTQLNSYKVLLESSPDIIFQLDRNYTIVFSHMPGLSSEKSDVYSGTNILDLTPDSMKKQLLEVLASVFKTGKTCVYETEGAVRTGYKYFLNQMSAIKNEQGDIEYAYFVGRETTTQILASMKALDSEQKLTALFEGSSQIIALFDKEGRFIWFNKTAYKKSIFILNDYIKVGDYMYRYLKAELQEPFKEKFNKVLKGEIISYSREFQFDNKPLFVDLLLQPVYQNGNLVAVSMIGNNVTERKEYETKLEKANNELLQQNEQLNQYSYIISHNLRAPIVSLMGLISLLGHDYGHASDRDEIISHIAKSANHLDVVIKDLNHLLAIGDVTLATIPVDLRDEIDTVMFLLENEIKLTKPFITIDFSKCPIIVSLKSSIHNILYNLLSNALKYHQSGKVPEVSIYSYILSEKFACIEVTDKGIGIDLQKYEDKLFGFYKRFHFHVEGKGLGLHLIKRQVDSLGGRIEVESTVGLGTTFKVILPI